MLVEDCLQGLLVAAAHRLELPAVDVERVPVRRDAAGVRVADRREPAGDTLHGRLDRVVVAGADERAMEHRVRAHHARALAEVSLEQLDRPFDRGEVGGGGTADGLEDDRSLEHATCAQDVDGGSLLELHRRIEGDRGHEVGCDEDPARLAATDVDEPRQLEHPQRLAERRLRDAELRGKVALVRQPVARAQARPLDGLGQVLDRGLEGARRADRLDLERRRRGHRAAVSQDRARETTMRFDRKRATLFHFRGAGSAGGRAGSGARDRDRR